MLIGREASVAAGAVPQGNGTQPAATARRNFVVGVTGHRLDGLQSADLPLLQRRIHDCLQVVCNVVARCAGHGTDLHLIVASPLAEGADRLVAEEAIALGFALYAPLPFLRDEYESDFTSSASRAAFRDLLACAEEVHEFAGTRTAAPAAYEAAGRAVIDSSDMLIAVWDGRAARGDGGTGQMVFEAIHHHLLTIWIPAAAPHLPILLAEHARDGVLREKITLLPIRVAERVRRASFGAR
jgi:hypothetical protein